ncbi:ABC transporter substrate-binding protein [Paludibaculum fermentans]|uniref:ABC transporter substrate-binding protein n=1 Tax=Paludibaculum fermentans TaxID=1473598 RepID=UPI003EBE126A
MAARGDLLSAVGLGVVLVWGCGRTPIPPEAQQPRAGGSLRLIYQTPPDTLDPQAMIFLLDAEIAALPFEGLVGHGVRPGEVRPLLAESWEQSEGGRVWTFTLREAWFHDDPCFPAGTGRRVTAEDVRWTLERIARPGAEWPNWYLFAGKVEGLADYHAGRAKTIRGVQVLDERRVRIRLVRPYASFLRILATQAAYIAPREAEAAYGAEYGRHAVGTGPFRLVRWKAAGEIVLVRHGRYWRRDESGARLPHLDSVTIQFRPEASEAGLVAAFLKGETQVLAARRDLLEKLAQSEGAARWRTAGQTASLAFRFLGFSMDNGGPLARHAELRRALALALDRAALGKTVPAGPVRLAETLAPPQLLGREGQWYSLDPVQAGRLLDKWRPELEQRPPVLASNFDSDDVGLLRRGLGRLGVTAQVRIRPAGYYGYIAKERPDLFRVSFTPSFGDPEDYYCLFYSRSSPDVNLTGYRNAEFDRVLESAMTEMDEARRRELFQRLEQILKDDVPALYLSHGTPLEVATAPQLRGVVVRQYFPDFAAAWLAGSEAVHENRPAR